MSSFWLNQIKDRSIQNRHGSPQRTGRFWFADRGTDFYCTSITVTSTILLFSLLSLHGQIPSGVSIGQELTDLHRGLHAKCLGYMDIGQIQDLVPLDRAQHQAYGELKGVRESRRITMLMMGPDSTAISRIGLLGGWQGGGWARDAYLGLPSTLHLWENRWVAGVAAARTDLDLFGAAGWYHTDPAQWRGPFGYRTEDGHDDFWGDVRWHRIALVAAGGMEGLRLARFGLVSNPTGFGKYDQKWFWPQLEGALIWNQAAWNPWSDKDAIGAQAIVPVMGERLGVRGDYGSDGFRLVQLQSNLDPQGNVGLDLSWSQTRTGSGPGVRFRAPFLCFSWNDPDDIAAFGISHRGMVWAIRLQMTWEQTETWYRPGRRPDMGGIR